MTTTFEKFNGTNPGNYCSNPTKDVEILENNPHHCETCGEEIVWIRSEDPYNWRGSWDHKDPNHGHAGKLVGPVGQCRYCHAEEVVFTQEAWYDRSECKRCGGVYGFAIGD